MTLIDLFWFYPAALFAVMIVGISKGGFGGGLGLVAVPTLSLVISPVQAAAIMLPILCAMDLIGLRHYWRIWHWVNLKYMLPGALAGILIGSLTFRYMDADTIRLLLGGIAVVFALDYFRPRRITPRPTEPNLPRGTFWSILSGFTSFVAHSGGPPISVYLLPQRMDRTVFVGTTVVFFTAVNYVKLVPYSLLGMFDASNLLTSFVLLPLAPLGMIAGFWLHRRVNERLFYTLCYSFVLIAGIKLTYDGLAGTGLI